VLIEEVLVMMYMFKKRLPWRQWWWIRSINNVVLFVGVFKNFWVASCVFTSFICGSFCFHMWFKIFLCIINIYCVVTCKRSCGNKRTEVWITQSVLIHLLSSDRERHLWSLKYIIQVSMCLCVCVWLSSRDLFIFW
jgi:hypothetical protein